MWVVQGALSALSRGNPGFYSVQGAFLGVLQVQYEAIWGILARFSELAPASDICNHCKMRPLEFPRLLCNCTLHGGSSASTGTPVVTSGQVGALYKQQRGYKGRGKRETNQKNSNICQF
jgi:hypothetical protein